MVTIDHVLVVEIEEQDDEHVAFRVPNAERREVDDRDTGEEFVEAPSVSRLFDEDLQIDQVGENAVRRVDLVADEGLVSPQDIDKGRDAARRAVVSLHRGGLEMISLPRSEPGSSPLQHRDHARQRRPVDCAVDDHPAIARKHDLHPPRRRHTLRDHSLG